MGRPRLPVAPARAMVGGILVDGVLCKESCFLWVYIDIIRGLLVIVGE